MRDVFRTVAALRSALSAHRDLLLESLALRHQLGVLARSDRRFRPSDPSALGVLAMVVAPVEGGSGAGPAIKQARSASKASVKSTTNDILRRCYFAAEIVRK